MWTTEYAASPPAALTALPGTRLGSLAASEGRPAAELPR